MRAPLYPGYFADPFVLALGEGRGYGAIGTGASGGSAGSDPAGGDRVFEVLHSPDLRHWTPRGRALNRLPERFGDEYWAPEVAFEGGRYWLYYSVGRGIAGHHLRVAVADSFFGPYDDVGVDLTPDERFAIDAHPFHDADDQWYLYFARDVLDSERAGTQLAVAPLATMTSFSAAPSTVLQPNGDWQRFERDRPMYGGVYDWHTLEGPSVVHRDGRYLLLYSGGNWTGAGYGVSWAEADSPLGPWSHAPDDRERLLASTPELVGPGHNSLVSDGDGRDGIVFHAWDHDLTARRMFANHVDLTRAGPRLLEAIE